MRVLHFFKTYWPDTFGGVEHVIHAIATGLAGAGVETSVLSLSRSPAAADVLFDGHWAHKSKLLLEFASTGFSVTVFSRFRELARDADIIHYHFPWPFMDIVHLVTRPGKPCVVTYHSDIVRQKTLLRLYRPVMRAFLNSVDRIVATSPDYLAGSTELNRFKDKATVIPIGINRQHYPAVSPDRKSYWRNLLPERFFLFVGVLRYYKGLPTLLNAAAETGYPVVIVGDGPEGPGLKQLADSLKLGNCFFLGAVNDEDKVALLDLAYALAFPSHLRSEAFGVSLVEASMFHTPMITCDIGTGTSYVNRDGVTGYVVPPENPQAFAAAMNTLWQNPAGRNAMGEAAFQRYSALFTADRMAAGYLALYESLLNGEPPSHTAG